MALWARTQQLTGNLLRQVQEMYSSRFPMEVRHSIANWLETQNWKAVDENNDEALAFYYLEQMEQQINDKAMSITADEQSFPYMLRLRESATSLRMAYQDNPLALVRFIRDSLLREEQLVMMACGEPMKQENQVSQTEQQILKDMEVLRKAVSDAGCHVREMQQKHEYFVIQYQHNQKIEDAIRILSSQNQTSQKQAQIKKLETENKNQKALLRDGARELNNKRGTMYDHMANMMQLFKSLSHMVFDKELVAWKNLQKQATFKTDLVESHVLNKIQRWCEELASLLNDCKQQVMRLQMLEGEIPSVSENNKIEDLNRELREFLKDLLLKSFVVNQQPPQVVRKDARFTANVRLLVGHKLNVFMSMPTVEASIISEPQARAIACEGCIPEGMENAGDILNSKGTMEYSQGQMSVTFRNMQLKRIKRADRKGQELVVEEKFCLLFRAKIQADMKYETWTMSLPIVVTVHGNQECQAQATILWDNAFSEPTRVPFAVPDQVPWKDLSSLLSYWYQSKTGACLTYDHLQIIAAKLFGEGIPDYSNCMVTRSQFHKDHLQPGIWNFSLWEWLYLVQKVTKEFLQQPWVDGLIMGFVSKKKAQDLLLSKPPGTFLLRYSDTELGGISIVYNFLDTTDQKIDVANLCPFTDRDFRIRCLADRIQDLKNLHYLFPNTSKEVAFGKYWTRSSNAIQTNAPGVYIPHILTMNILGPNQNEEAAQMQQIQQPMSNMTMNSMDTEYLDDDLASYLSPMSNPEFVPNPDFVTNPDFQGNPPDFTTNEFGLAYLS